jgi:hypothetical protein
MRWDECRDNEQTAWFDQQRQHLEGPALLCRLARLAQPVEESSPLARRKSLVCSVYLIGVQVIENGSFVSSAAGVILLVTSPKLGKMRGRSRWYEG